MQSVTLELLMLAFSSFSHC